MICYAIERYFSGREYKAITPAPIAAVMPLKSSEKCTLPRNISYWIESASGLSDCALLTAQQQRRKQPSRTRSAKFILDGCFWLCYSLSVKVKLEDSLYKLCFQMVLYLVIDTPLVHRKVLNTRRVVLQYCVYCFRLSGDSFFNDFKRYQFLIPHVLFSPFLFLTVSMLRTSNS